MKTRQLLIRMMSGLKIYMQIQHHLFPNLIMTLTRPILMLETICKNGRFHRLLKMRGNTSLTKWDILSFSSYKYVGIIVVLMLGLLLNSKGYYIGLVYVSAALMFFLLRTLKLRIEPEVSFLT